MENQPNVIYEDNHLVVVIKPQNMPTQADDSGDLDLLNQIKQYIKESAGKTGEAFCGLVHRLDRVTGGVMVFTKTSKAAARLSEQLKDGKFTKKYLAVVLGEPPLREATLVDYLLKNEKKNIVEVVPSATTGAKRAELRYKVRNITNAVSLVEVDLITGRSHQVRVQMSKIGCPVFGDTKYGGDKLAKGWNLALWAYELVFTHPTNGDTMRFIVNPPETTPWDKFDFKRIKHPREVRE
jgi:23S rRNA pseudouridine1911/1915/1917 synthase